MVDVVAERGLQGASMSLVAKVAGVATGTAYVHYESKEDLLIAAFVEVKTQLGTAAFAGVDPAAAPRQVFEAVWRNCYKHLSADPPLATFLLQVEASPLRSAAHEALPGDDPLTVAADRLVDSLVDLPGELLYDLSLAAAVRLAAAGEPLGEREMQIVIDSCWRAISRP